MIKFDQVINKAYVIRRDLCKSKIIEFCLSTHDTNHFYFDKLDIRNDRMDGVMAPPAYIGILGKKAWSGFYKELNLDPNFVLMTKFHVNYYDLIHPYVDYLTEARIVKLTEKEKYYFFEIHHEITDPHQKIVATLDVGLGYPKSEV